MRRIPLFSTLFLIAMIWLLIRYPGLLILLMLPILIPIVLISYYAWKFRKNLRNAGWQQAQKSNYYRDASDGKIYKDVEIKVVDEKDS